MSLYDTKLAALDGTPDVLANEKGKVTLLVNVASFCGLTPQYEGLQQLEEKYGPQGFDVIGIPCNQFGEQEPGTADEIKTFCSTNYNVSFPLTEKIEVNGDNRHPLYQALTPVKDAEGRDGDIQWNFEKFLVGRDGNVIPGSRRWFFPRRPRSSTRSRRRSRAERDIRNSNRAELGRLASRVRCARQRVAAPARDRPAPYPRDALFRRTGADPRHQRVRRAGP
jgi:glutathione peroxidase